MTGAFRGRIEALVARDGSRAVADFYGVSQRTVQRWAAGTHQPRSASVQRSVIRRGRSETGPALQTRDSTGRFRTVTARTRTLRAARSIQQARERRAEVREREARTPAQRAFAERSRAEAEDTGSLAQFAEDWEGWREELDRGLRDDWEDWRGTYEQMAG